MTLTDTARKLIERLRARAEQAAPPMNEGGWADDSYGPLGTLLMNAADALEQLGRENAELARLLEISSSAFYTAQNALEAAEATLREIGEILERPIGATDHMEQRLMLIHDALSGVPHG